MGNNKVKNLRQKLFEIQQKHTTFAQTEPSEKREKGGKPSYSYTPGWKIVESIRSAMDKLGIMLDSTVVEESHEMISYPVYKEIRGQIITFEKKEIYVTQKRNFTWVDVETDEKLGPYTEVSAGANGTDKSIASAISLAERYFLLKFFHISTRDKDDEPDAHDSSAIPGNIPNYTQQNNMTLTVPTEQKQQPPQTQTVVSIAKKEEGNIYDMAVRELSFFGKGTQSHMDALNKWMIILNQSGYSTSDPKFATNLTEAAQAKRENREPNYI